MIFIQAVSCVIRRQKTVYVLREKIVPGWRFEMVFLKLFKYNFNITGFKN